MAFQKGGFQRRNFLAEARRGVQEAYKGRDILLSHTVKAILELNRAANLLYETLTEWYAIHFPELKVNEPEKFAELVQKIDKAGLKASDIDMMVGEAKAKELEEKAKSSIGVDLNSEDVMEIKRLATQLNELYKLRASFEKYQEKLARELAPNISIVAGPELAAKLIARAGNLRRLAMMPASTIQVLGAEKALFKHLRKHTKPPKHGLIFQHVSISMSPKEQRGKIARALSTKIAIASKADAFSKRMIADKLKADFDARLKMIKGEK